MSSYQSPDDLAYAKQLMQSANKEASAFLNLKATAERKKAPSQRNIGN
ncbi:hypothetical protein [Aquabacterium sp.]|nr:hypothetical protein [Aquabacterium sp.]